MSKLLREISTNNSGNGTGLPFAASCLAWYFKELLGYTYTEHPDSFLGYAKTGTNGEFNLTGTDKDFRDATAASFIVGDVGNWIVVKSANSRNAGIYQISAYVSPSTVTLDFRSGSTEYPTGETSITWWMISAVPAAAAGALTAPDPTAVSDGMFSLLDDGQGINYQKVLILSKQNPGTYSPNQWRGGVVAGSQVSALNSLVGTSLNLTIGSTTTTVTFTGSNPVSMSSIISQINNAFTGSYTAVCYESDERGYASSGGYLTFRAQLTGKIFGQPAEKPSADLNNITLTYSGSTAWSYLGLTGTSNLTAGNLTQAHKQCDNVPPNETATQVANWCRGVINGWGSWIITAGGATATITLTNDYAGCHGNKALVGSWAPDSGMSGGAVPTAEGVFFRVTTPHALGWTIEMKMHFIFSAPRISVRVSANGSFDTDGKILGPIYFGSAASAVNWFYAEADTDGKWVNVWSHQSTNNRYNGFIVSNLEPFDTGHLDEEKVVLMGNIGSGSSDYDNWNFIRNYDDKRVGHGYVWVDGPIQAQKNVYFLEPTLGGYANGLSKWTSRERNRRISGSQVGDFTGNSLSFSGGTVTLTKSGATFTSSDIGKKIRISNCTNAGNNGLFTITAVPGSTQVQFLNASGVTESPSFSWTMDFQDVIEGSYIVLDPDNTQGLYAVYARLKGHYSVRGGTTSGWSNRKAFTEDSFLDRYHINDGISVSWPGLTPQH